MGDNFSNPWDAFNQNANSSSNDSFVQPAASNISNIPEPKEEVVNNSAGQTAVSTNPFDAFQPNAAQSGGMANNNINTSNVAAAPTRPKTDWKKLFRPLVISLAVMFVSFIMAAFTGFSLFFILITVGELGFFASVIYIGYYLLFKWKIRK